MSSEARTVHTLPLSPPERLVYRAASWRNGLRTGSARQADRFNDCVAPPGIRTASLLVHLAPLTKSATSAAVACSGYGPCVVQIAGQWQGSVLFEASNDGDTWHPLELIALHSGARTVEATGRGMWRTPVVFPARFFRLHAHTISGTAVGVVAAAPLPWSDHLQLPHAA